MRTSITKQFRNFLSIASFRADAGLGIVGSPSPDSDYWYHGLGQRSAAGPNVSPGSATRLAAVFACTRVCAETLSSLPIGIFRERKSGGRDPATDHPAQELFLKPNSWQTGMEFFEMMQAHLELRGNAYAHKISGNGRAIDQLIPLHPDRVRVYLLPDNRLRYEVTAYSSGQIDRFSQDEILHLRGWSFNGITGISTVSALAEVIGVGLAQQDHRARYFRNNAIPGLALESLKMTDEAREKMTDSMSEKFSGEGAFKVFAPPPGVTVKTLGLTNKDSQLIEASHSTSIEICGAWRVPPHKIGDLARGTFSNIEQQNIEFATDCQRPRVVRMERRLDADVVNSLRAFESASGDYFVGFNMDALYRGDMKSRYDAYSVALPWMRRNEMRRNEGLNPIDGLDEPLVPVNLETVAQAQQRSDNATTTANASADASAERDASGPGSGGAETPENDSPAEDQQNALAKSRLRAHVMNAAGRIVRREAKSLRKMAIKSAADPAPFHGEVWDFYRALAPVVAESMLMPLDSAEAYCFGHAGLIAKAAPVILQATIDQIEVESTEALTEQALLHKSA
jgi:HK97 family phage portal protein